MQGALELVRPYMESHGGNVELLSLEDGVARISLRGSCSDCSASSVTLELAIKQALEEAAPDLEGLEVEGVAPQTTGMALPMAAAGGARRATRRGHRAADGDLAGCRAPCRRCARRSPRRRSSWFELDRRDLLTAGRSSPPRSPAAELVVANVEGTLLAYRDACAGCGGTLHDGELADGALACPHCARSFFLPRAGRSMDEERIQLDPVPLLRELGRVKVALAAVSANGSRSVTARALARSPTRSLVAGARSS